VTYRHRSNVRRRLLNFTLELPPDWGEITRDMPGLAPPTIAKVRGVGALQFSQAEFEEPPEGFTPDDLLEIVRGVARRADESIAFDERKGHVGPLVVGAVSMTLEGNFVRLWGLSDGREVVVATYTCSWNDREREAEECRRVVESIRIVRRIVGVA
jgi:hypothetical protein